MGLAWNICAPLGTLSTFFFNPVFQVSTAKNEINLFNNHILIEAPVTFAPAGAMTPSAEFLFFQNIYKPLIMRKLLKKNLYKSFYKSVILMQNHHFFCNFWVLLRYKKWDSSEIFSAA